MLQSHCRPLLNRVTSAVAQKIITHAAANADICCVEVATGAADDGAPLGAGAGTAATALPSSSGKYRAI